MAIAMLGQSGAWDGVDLARDLSLFSPMIALVVTMLAVVACPIIIGRDARKIGVVAGLGMVVALLCCFKVAGITAGGPQSGLSPGEIGGMLIADQLSTGFQIILMLFMIGVYVLWWLGSAATEENAPEFFILLIGSALGMALMVSSVNLLMIIVAIEAASLPSYAIVGFDKRDRLGAEASLKYMIFGAVSAAIMLYGASLLYGMTGSLNLGVVAEYVVGNLSMDAGSDGLIVGMGLLCFMAGIAFKISAVPFHFWCPDAFEGAKIEVTTWLSVASKAAGLILLTRIVLALCGALAQPAYIPTITPIAWTIGIIAAVTCTVGNFAAYMQQSVKRMLAYSSIAHAGYMMMATAVFIHPEVPGATLGVTALLIYVVVYLFMNLGAFGVTAVVVWETGSDNIASFTGLIRRAPWLAVPMVICLMSLVGLPPFAGFIGKWWILVALGSMEQASPSLANLGWFLVIAAVVNTLVSLYYYMRIVVQMTLKDDQRPALESPFLGTALVNVCAVLLLVLFVFAGPLKDHAASYAEQTYIFAAGETDDQASLASANESDETLP